MSLIEQIAKSGNPGIVARWVAQAYTSLSAQKPNASLHEIIDAIFINRFMVVDRNEEHIQYVIENRYSICNLADTVIAILEVEVGYSENTDEMKSIFDSVIVNELLEIGIDAEAVYLNSSYVPY